MQPVSDGEHQDHADDAFCAGRKYQFSPRTQLDETAQKKRVSDGISDGVHGPRRPHRACCQEELPVDLGLVNRRLRAADLNNQGPDNSQYNADYLSQCELLPQKQPGQHGDQKEHRIVDNARLYRRERAQGTIPQCVGQGAVDHRQPAYNGPVCQRQARQALRCCSYCEQQNRADAHGDDGDRQGR